MLSYGRNKIIVFMSCRHNSRHCNGYERWEPSTEFMLQLKELVWPDPLPTPITIQFRISCWLHRLKACKLCTLCMLPVYPLYVDCVPCVRWLCTLCTLTVYPSYVDSTLSILTVLKNQINVPSPNRLIEAAVSVFLFCPRSLLVLSSCCGSISSWFLCVLACL